MKNDNSLPIIKDTIMKTNQTPINQNVWIGHTKFKPSFTNKMMQDLIAVSTDNYFAISCWNKWSSDSSPNFIPFVFSQIQKTQFGSIYVSAELSPQMHKSIVMPVYNNLLFLSIKNSKLQNIEFLNYFKTECVTTINLLGNQITSIKPMNKLKWKNLGFIILSENPICEIDLSRVKTHAQFKQLKLQEQIDHSAIGNDLSFICKLNAGPRTNDKKTNLFITCQRRIVQNTLMKTLTKKAPSLQIQDFKSIQPVNRQIMQIYQIQEMEIEQNQQN